MNINEQYTETHFLEHAIASHPFWSGLNPRYLHLVNDCASYLQLPYGEFIFKSGDHADKLFLIQEGQVSLDIFVPHRGNISIDALGAGEALGWSWMFPPYEWSFSARTLEPTGLIAFDGIELLEKADENHDFGHDLLRRVSLVLVKQLQTTRRKLVEFYEPPGCPEE